MAQYNKTMWINNETVVDAQKLNKLENQMHLITQSSITNSGRLEAVEDLVDTKLDDVDTTETDDGTLVKFYANGKVKEQVTVQGGNGIKVGPTEPTNKKHVWLDTTDQDLDATLTDSTLYEQIESRLSKMEEVVHNFDYAINYKLDAGYFKNKIPGTEDPIPSGVSKTPFAGLSSLEKPEPPEGLSPRPQGTINCLTIKRGYQRDLDLAYDGELGYCIDKKQLYIKNGNSYDLIGSNGGGNNPGTTVSSKFIELQSQDNSTYRVSVDNDGNLNTTNLIAYTSSVPTLEEANKFDGLVIRHVYGGGELHTNTAPVSHGFIELYNNRPYVFNLNGLSIQYATKGTEWQVLPLTGIVRPYHSFLIRCGEHTEIDRKTARVKIKDYDMSWDIAISDKAKKFYLCVGTEKCTYSNPCNIGEVTKIRANGFINFFAVGGITDAGNGLITSDYPIDAFDTDFRYCCDINHSAHRRDSGDWSDESDKTINNKNYCFSDTRNNAYDIEGLDMRHVPLEMYTPRSSKYGRWDAYYNKRKLTIGYPNMINMCYGYDGHTTRTFTWQTDVDTNSFLYWKKKGEADWKIEATDKKIVGHPDTSATVHSVIIRNLTPGTYIYKCGIDGRYSDEATFEVKVPTNSDTIKFMQIGDMQSWTEREYTVWRECNKLMQTIDHDFVINVGDISQNGGDRAYEWRYYYEMAPQLRNKCHMTTCGNNDLTYRELTAKKDDRTAFTWYTTVENSPYISCYSWNYGFIHFISIDSNFPEDTALKQIEWLEKDLAKPENQKRWTVLYMHEPPYSHIRSTRLQTYINAFARLGVDVVLGGHHHRYTRSKRMGALVDGQDTVSSTGVYYVMGQAAGYKLAGKILPDSANLPKWNEVHDPSLTPMIILWEATQNSLKMTAYHIEKLMPLETNLDKGSIPELKVRDTLTITK